MNNEIVLRFGIFDFEDVSHDDITSMLDLLPTKVLIKGQRRNPKNTNSPLINRNGWLIDAPSGKYSSFEDQMTFFIELIYSKLDLFRPLCKRYYCEFSCALFIYADNEESTPWIHLGSRYNKMAEELNIEFDLDLYVIANEI